MRREALRRKRRRLLLREPLVQRAELLLGDGLRHAGRQPHDRIDQRQVGARRRQRQPEPVVAVPAEPRRHHADDGVRPAVQPQRPAERRRAALEQPQPQPVAQHDDRFGLAVRPDVGRLDRPADDRRHAEEVEGVAGQQDAAEALGRELAGHAARFRSTSPSRRRTPAPRPAAEARRASSVCPPRPSTRAHLRRPDLARPRVRIRRDEDAVDDAEDGRGRADAQRQRQQRDQHERRAAPERPDGIAEILSQRFEPASHARLLEGADPLDGGNRLSVCTILAER